jgi:hypothetical protein
MAISNMQKKFGKSQENFAVIRYSPAILLSKVAIKTYIKSNGIFKARRRSYFRQR